MLIGYAGERVATATRIIVEIVAKSPDQIGFAVLPRRWVVERFFAWIGRNRRLAKDFEASIDSARASLYAASVMLLSRRNREARMSFETDSKWPAGRIATLRRGQSGPLIRSICFLLFLLLGWAEGGQRCFEEAE